MVKSSILEGAKTAEEKTRQENTLLIKPSIIFVASFLSLPSNCKAHPATQQICANSNDGRWQPAAAWQNWLGVRDRFLIRGHTDSRLEVILIPDWGSYQLPITGSNWFTIVGHIDSRLGIIPIPNWGSFRLGVIPIPNCWVIPIPDWGVIPIPEWASYRLLIGGHTDSR